MYDIKISMTLKWWTELLLVLDNNGLKPFSVRMYDIKISMTEK